MSVTYRYFAHQLVGDQSLIAELPLTGVSFGRILNGAGPFAATLQLPPLPRPSTSGYSDVYTDVYAADAVYLAALASSRDFITGTEPGRTALYIERNGEIVWGGIIWTRDDPAGDGNLRLTGAEFHSYWRRRKVRWNVTHTGVDQLAIYRDQITRAQAVVGGSIGVVVGSETSGVTRDRQYTSYEDKNLGEALEQLAAVDGGFDFSTEVTLEAGAYVRRLRLHYPRKGRTAAQTGHLWELGANLTILGYREDGTRGANYVTARGAGEGLDMLTATASEASFLGAGFPLLEESLSLKDVTVATTLSAHARGRLEALRMPVTVPGAVVRGDQDPAVGSFETGDYARLRAQPGQSPRWPDGVDFYARITAYNVAVPDEGGPEAVTLDFEVAA